MVSMARWCKFAWCRKGRCTGAVEPHLVLCRTLTHFDDSHAMRRHTEREDPIRRDYCAVQV